MARSAVLQMHHASNIPAGAIGAAVWPSDPQQLVDAIPLPCWLEDASGDLLAANAAASSVVRRGPHGGDALRREARVSTLEIGGETVRMFVAVDATKALREREQHLRSLIDGSVDIIYETDKQGRFSFVNAAVEQILGYTPRSLVSRHFSELVRPDWRERTINHYVAQRQSVQASTLFEFPVVAADGHDVWVSQNVQSVLDDDDVVVGFRAVARDITERRMVEERFEAFMNNSPTGAFIKDAEGRYVYANGLLNRLLAPEGSTIVGLTDEDLLPSGVAMHIQESDEQVLRTSVPLQVVDTVATADGTMSHWFTSKFPIMADGRSAYVGGVAIDLTDRITLERELAAARDAALVSAREKSQFLANMSHEIRTPMNGVLGMLGVLSDTQLNDDQRDLVDTARSSADSLLSIINDILDFSKIEAGKLNFEQLEFDIRSTCDSVIDILTESVRVKSLEIGFVFDPTIPKMLLGDAGRLRQVLLNLAGNAIKFTSEGGVLIQVEREPAEGEAVALQFRITDSGVGISAAVRKHLFQPFTQEDASTTRKFGGTGLGLAISKELVRMMDGEIGVESEPGCGSTFWFTATFGCSDLTLVAAPAAAPPRVLVVEDSMTTRQIIALQLTAWHVPNETTDSAMTALMMLREAASAGSPFDVVITDLNMPELSGAAMARLICENPGFGAPRIVLVTGSTSSFDAVGLATLGITTSLRKPVKPHHLRAAVFGESQPARTPARVRVPAIAPVDSGRKRVLVVDDNAVNQKVALRQLQKLGIAADAVGNGLEAVEAVARMSYELVLMDCQMPEMDGYEATAEIRAGESGTARHLPIIAITASASDSDRERCLNAGMDDFISKPVREDELRATIARWMPAAVEAIAAGTLTGV